MTNTNQEHHKHHKHDQTYRYKDEEKGGRRGVGDETRSLGKESLWLHRQKMLNEIHRLERLEIHQEDFLITETFDNKLLFRDKLEEYC